MGLQKKNHSFTFLTFLYRLLEGNSIMEIIYVLGCGAETLFVATPDTTAYSKFDERRQVTEWT